MKRVLIPLAPGFEEIEAITVIDILRRAGVEVTVAGTQAGPIEASRKTRHLPDCTLDEVRAEHFDMLVLPGGQPGATNLRQDPRIQRIIEVLRSQNRQLAAICAAPTVLAAYGILEGRTATGHPSVREELSRHAAHISEDRVVVDGAIITSQSAGTAMEFAFKLVELLCGPAKAAEVNQSVGAAMIVVVTLVLLAGVGWLMVLFNTLITLSNEADMIWADIDSQFNRRRDLIPQLIELTKGDCSQEPTVLTALMAAREAATAACLPLEKSRTEPVVADAIRAFLTRAESFSDLKASEAFRDLQQTLVDIETYIQQSRTYYNTKVGQLNHCVEGFPGNLVASALGVRARELYQTDAQLAQKH